MAAAGAGGLPGAARCIFWMPIGLGDASGAAFGAAEAAAPPSLRRAIRRDATFIDDGAQRPINALSELAPGQNR